MYIYTSDFHDCSDIKTNTKNNQWSLSYKTKLNHISLFFLAVGQKTPPGFSRDIATPEGPGRHERPGQRRERCGGRHRSRKE